MLDEAQQRVLILRLFTGRRRMLSQFVGSHWVKQVLALSLASCPLTFRAGGCIAERMAVLLLLQHLSTGTHLILIDENTFSILKRLNITGSFRCASMC